MAAPLSFDPPHRLERTLPTELEVGCVGEELVVHDCEAVIDDTLRYLGRCREHAGVNGAMRHRSMVSVKGGKGGCPFSHLVESIFVCSRPPSLTAPHT